MSGRVEGRVAIVTGGARGQGAAHGEQLAREGATVVLTDILDAEGEAEAARQRAQGLPVEYAHLDVSKAGEWDALVEQSEGRHGKVDVLVNNAGDGVVSNCELCTDADWDFVIAVNQSGVFYGMRAAIPSMRRAGGGSIINTSSTLGVTGAPYFAYVASKHAVIGMTRSVAITHAVDNIRANAIAPGVIHTPMLEAEMADPEALDIDEMLATQPIHRMGLAVDVSHAVVYLASEESSYVTGVVLPVDGGFGAQ